MNDAETFEAHRPHLVAHAYRMLGDVGRAEDLVQETWLRWAGRKVSVQSPRAYLLKTVTRLCLSELTSARRRREIRGDRLPEPIDLQANDLDQVERLEEISMAFVVLLQRLTAAERATFLLRDVFDFSHREIGELLGKSDAACRQLLKRARACVAEERRSFEVSDAEHSRLLHAFVRAARDGDQASLSALLHADVVMIADAGAEGRRYGGVKNLPGPLIGRRKVAAFAASVAPRGAGSLTIEERRLNGRPAILVWRDGRPDTAISVAVVDRKLRAIFLQADPTRLRFEAPRTVQTVPANVEGSDADGRCERGDP
ncbi:MAG: sigma-70 family RNA polymerase sigma factor [Myxococcota bacterium]